MSYFAIPFVRLILLYRLYIGKEDKHRIKERIGLPSVKNRPDGEVVWIHAVSAGETSSAMPIINELSKRYTVLLTTSTSSSLRFIDGKLNSGIIHQMSPVDAAPYVKRFLKFWKPEFFLVFESEIWPNSIYYASKYAKIINVNGKSSEKSIKKWRKAINLYSFIVNRYSYVVTSDYEYAELLCEADYPPSKVLFKSSTKYDAIDLTQKGHFSNAYSDFLKKKYTLCIASIHHPEWDILSQVILETLNISQDIAIVIAPRRLYLSSVIAEFLSKNNIKYVVYSGQTNFDKIDNRCKVVILNTIGDLNEAYAASKLAFIGGSLVDGIGGHNPLEPVAFGLPVLIGKKCYSVEDTCKEMFNVGILRFVDSNEIVNAVSEAFHTKESKLDLRAKEFLKSRQGTSSLVCQLIDDLSKNTQAPQR